MRRSDSTTVNVDTHGITVEIPFQPLFDWWEKLVARNREARELDAPVPPILVPLECFECGADASHLAFDDSGEVTTHTCLWCGSIH